MKRTLIFILILLFATLIAWIILSVIFKDFDAVTYLHATSSFTIAVLTVFYVLINSNQLEIMSKQLNEMKKDRELQNQPLPWVENIRLEVKAPKLFSSLHFFSRYFAYIDLNNLSDTPAISIDVISTIFFTTEGKKRVLTSCLERVDTLAANQKYPQDEKDEKISFLFAEDTAGELFHILRSDETPILKIEILYRNILGGCFLIKNEYQLLHHAADDDDIIELWHTDIVSFKTKEKERLRALTNIKEEAPFWNFYQSISDSYKYDKEMINLSADPLPGTFEVKTLSVEDYNMKLSGGSYGRKIKYRTVKMPNA